VRTALDRIMTKFGLIWWIERGEVRIGASLPASMYFLRRHDIADLVAPAPGSGTKGSLAGDGIADRVRDQIDPAVWKEGGKVWFGGEDKVLMVRAPPKTHERVRVYLAELRTRDR